MDTPCAITPAVDRFPQMWIPAPELVRDIDNDFGTPVFAYDHDFAKDVFRRLREALPHDLEIFYSLKANPNISVAHHVCRFGAGAEVSSLAELRTALCAGVAPQDIIFVGPAKSSDELRACVEDNIYAIVCESIDELASIDLMMRESPSGKRSTPIILRINPEFAGTGSGLAMGGKPRQFGIDEQQVRAAVGYIRSLSAVDIIGLHVYMGTRYLDSSPIIRNTRSILGLAQKLAAELQVPLKAVDIGGGLGVPYFEKESPLDMVRLEKGIAEAVARFRQTHPQTRLIMELGRYLVAGCGVLLTKVRYIKESMGETFAITDGGTNLHMAAVGIGSFVKRNFPMRNFSAGNSQFHSYTITGPLCTPNDTLAKRIRLPRVQVGDVLGVLLSGAYGPTASPTHFLSHGYPAEVLVMAGKAHLIRVRDRPEDLLEKQRLVPSHATDPAAKEREDGATFEFRPGRRDDLGPAEVAGQAPVS